MLSQSPLEFSLQAAPNGHAFGSRDDLPRSQGHPFYQSRLYATQYPPEFHAIAPHRVHMDGLFRYPDDLQCHLARDNWIGYDKTVVHL